MWTRVITVGKNTGWNSFFSSIFFCTYETCLNCFSCFRVWLVSYAFTNACKDCYLNLLTKNGQACRKRSTKYLSELVTFMEL